MRRLHRADVPDARRSRAYTPTDRRRLQAAARASDERDPITLTLQEFLALRDVDLLDGRVRETRLGAVKVAIERVWGSVHLIVTYGRSKPIRAVYTGVAETRKFVQLLVRDSHLC